MASKRKDLTLDLKYEVINNIIIFIRKIIGANLSEPLSVELAGALLWCIYICIHGQSIWSREGPPVNAQRANIRPAE